MKFLFPYMARWKSVNWSRYQQIFTILAELGHEIHIIQAPSQDSAETNYQEIDIAVPCNLHLHEVEVNSTIWNLKTPLNKLIKKGYYSFKSIKKVKEIIKKYEIDVLFVYNIPQYPLLDIGSCVKIFDFADDYKEMLKQELGKFMNPFILGIANKLLNRMIRKSDLVCVVSNCLAQTITSEKRKMHVFPNGVTLNKISVGEEKNIGDSYIRPIIGFIGSFEYFIDFDLILSAAECLHYYTFLMVGTGREFKQVQEVVRSKGLKNVILTGGVPHREAMRYIKAMDVCLNIFKKIPISHNACPIKLFEYLALRKPVISTRLNELQYIDTGFLFYADNPEELEKSIENILSNPDIVAQSVEKGYKLVEQKYQWKVIVEDLLRLIAGVLSHRREDN